MSEKSFVPVHVAVIMDGNGRWAVERHLPRFAGHHRGAERVREIVEAARDAGVKVLTMFAFSTENWSRSAKEIQMLFRYFHEFIGREQHTMQKNNIRLRVIGRRSKLPARTLEKIESVERLTAGNSGMTFVLAIDYGARQEIAEAVRRVCADVLAQKIHLDDIDENLIAAHLYTSELPDPDLLIRTSGEQRLSNFLLWQCSYTEFYFTKKYWPDFGTEDFTAALDEYRRRKRRFGSAA